MIAGESRPLLPGNRLYEPGFGPAQKLAPNFGFDRAFNDKPLPTAVPDQQVIVAIEARLRDGYLTLDDRNRINAPAPPDIRTRLARIEPPKSRCPAPP